MLRAVLGLLCVAAAAVALAPVRGAAPQSTSRRRALFLGGLSGVVALPLVAQASDDLKALLGDVTAAEAAKVEAAAAEAKLQAELDSMSVAEAIRAGPAPRFPPKRAFWLGSTARRRRLQEENGCEREQGGRGRGSAKIPRPRRGPGRRGRETGGRDAKSAQTHVAIAI